MARNIMVGATVRGRWTQNNFALEALGIAKQFELFKVEGLRAFAKEVRRRARIRIAVNRKVPAIVTDSRYSKRLKDAIDFEIGDNDVTFTVGAGIPYAAIEDQAKEDPGRMIYGNPVMKFFWYSMGRPYRFYRPGFVIRRGKGFFTGALVGAVADLDTIFGRVYDKEMAKVLK